jgi:LPPG:FO 2-phospho-L-lactate transferase
MPDVRIVVLAGGIGAARFLRGLLAHLEGTGPDSPREPVTVIGNTGDDISLYGLRVCPDLDTVMYTLGGGIDEAEGWGRAGDTYAVSAELAAYEGRPPWFRLGDRDLATHLVRTRLLGEGHPLSAVTEALCTRWRPGVRLIPMTDDRVETHVVIDDPDNRDHTPSGRMTAIHFQEYWVRLKAEPPARGVIPVGAERARPAPGVLDAIAAADLVLLPPSNPVVSIGTILAVPGIRDAVVAADAPVVGLSPIIGPAPVRGMADKMLAAVGVETSAAAVARFYGSDLLDGWLVDGSDAGAIPEVERAGIRCRAVPLLMRDVPAAAAMAAAAVELADRVRQ